jgi:hypothetical protein
LTRSALREVLCAQACRARFQHVAFSPAMLEERGGIPAGDGAVDAMTKLYRSLHGYDVIMAFLPSKAVASETRATVTQAQSFFYAVAQDSNSLSVRSAVSLGNGAIQQPHRGF